VDVQTAGGDISRLVEGFPGLRVFRCDGTDFLASYRTMRDVVTSAREGKGPALVHATVTRPYSHSFSDDERLYKTPGERDAEARRDPLRRMQQFLKTEGLATDQDLADIAASVDREVNQAAEEALRAPKPDPATAADFVFSPDIDPTRTSSRPNPSHRASLTRWSRPSTRH
jgi:2-oxoisovalerate dehydrogenase E1 component